MKALWCLAILAAFAAGYLLGQAGSAPLDRSGVAPALPPAWPPASPAAGGQPPRGVGVAAAAHVPEPDVDALLADFERLLRAGRFPEAGALRGRLVRAVRERASAGEAPAARALLEAMIAIDPFEHAFGLLSSELLQRQGRLDEAIEPLLVVLGQTDDPELVGLAREQLRLLVNVQEAQLVQRRDYRGVVRLYEMLVMRDPGHDGHRLALARWLLRDGRVEEAARVAREIGASGVSDTDRDDLLVELELARVGLPFEQDARGIHVQATLGGVPVRLLVDTGATTTVISATLARALGSRVVDRAVPVRTAGGTVSGELHRIRDLRVGALGLQELDVLVLEQLPPETEGLLGMDVLGRLPPTLPATLLGRPPASG